MLIDAMKCHASSGKQLDETDRSSSVVSIVKITYLWKERIGGAHGAVAGNPLVTRATKRAGREREPSLSDG